MATYSLSQIAHVINGSLSGNDNVTVEHIVTDSRLLFSANNSLFFAIKGNRHDGHDYIADLYQRKQLQQFVVEYIPQNAKHLPNISFIVVPNVLKSLQMLAAWHRQQYSYPVVAITGSNGKTIVKEWLYQLLHTSTTIVRSPKSYNSQIGVALSVWNMDNKAQLAIFEAGISEPNEMGQLQLIIDPQIGIFTNIGEAHQENFENKLQKACEKAILFKNAKKVIYCSDYSEIENALTRTVNATCKLISWSYSANSVYKLQVTIRDNTAILSISSTTKNITLVLPFTHKAAIENAMHCIVFMIEQGLNEIEMASRVSNLTSVAMRLELKKGMNACSIINDSYNSDLNALAIALDFMATQKQHSKRTLILSDILQTGRDEKQLYAEVNKLLLQKGVSRIIAIGAAIERNVQCFTVEKLVFKTTDDCIKHLAEINFSKEVILIKGARSFQFERISALLEEKRHRTVLEINLNAMVHNLNYFRSKLKPGTKIMAMVKALSYGSGTYEIANMLEYQKAHYLAVAFADEGVTLRQAGISLPIVVMNPEEAGFNLMIEHGLEPEIYSFRQLAQFLNALKTESFDQYPIHIKVDSGMHRLGFMPDQIDELCKILENNSHVKVSSIFSHLVGSDDAQHDTFTLLQIQRFTQMSDAIIKTCKYPIMRHILNSSGIERFPQAQFDMVRLGIGLYGISAINNNLVQQVSTLKTTISQIKNVSAFETIGYSRKGVIAENARIAILPIGYADGYNRRFSNGNGKVYINGQFAPIIGNICMDMCMVNITHINANEGDEVEVFGNNISISELASIAQTIPYEILTSVSERVKRVYFHE